MGYEYNKAEDPAIKVDDIDTGVLKHLRDTCNQLTSSDNIEESLICLTLLAQDLRDFS